MIDKEKVYSYFAKFHGPITPSTNGWYSCTCPVCGKADKFAVNFELLTGKCWRGCVKGFLVDIIQRYHGISHMETLDLIDSMETRLYRAPYVVRKSNKDTNSILPLGYKPILEGNTVLAVRARSYLQGRGFDLNYLDKIGVGYCDQESDSKEDNYFGYIIIPFKQHGTVVYFIARDYTGNFPRYKNPSKNTLGMGKSDFFFNEEALHVFNKVYLVEGWACAATFRDNGISMQGSKISTIQKNIILKSDAKQIIIVPDAGFYDRGLDMAYQILQYKQVKILDLDSLHRKGHGKDVNEIGLDLVYKLEDSTPFANMSFIFKEYAERSGNTH